MTQQLVSMEEFVNRKTLYVTNIDKKATKMEVKVDLQVLCPREVGVVVVPADQGETSNLGVAYCNFKAASDAKEALSMYRFNLRVWGKPVSIAYSVGKERGKILGAWGNQLTIIVKNLSPEVTEKIFCTKFEHFGEIFRCKVDIDAAGGKYGMAQFTKESSTIRAVECADNKTWFSTIIKVERHARAKLIQEENIIRSPSYRHVESMPSNQSQIDQSTSLPHSVPQHVDHWPNENLTIASRGLPPPPPPPPGGRPLSQGKAQLHHQPRLTNSFSAVAEDYEVTINGHDLQSFQLQEDNVESDFMEKKLESLMPPDDLSNRLPPVGIIGLMAKQRNLYSRDMSCNSSQLSGVGPGCVGDKIAVEAKVELSDTDSKVSSSHGHGLPHFEKRCLGIIDRGSKPVCSRDNQSTYASRGLSIIESIGHLSSMKKALDSILEPLERISGVSHNEGLLCCPITQEIFSEPVVAADGHTYERCAIEAWLERSQTSPNTNLKLEHTNLIPNILVKKILEELQLVKR